jgi:hypothetical protein
LLNHTKSFSEVKHAALERVTSNECRESVKHGPIFGQLKTLEVSIGDVSDSLCRLADLIEPVLGPEAPASGDQCTDWQPACSGLSGDLARLIQGVMFLRYRVDSLISRCEL